VINLSARQRQTGVYAEALWMPKNWTISGSGRVDHFVNFDAQQFQPSPKPFPNLNETVFDPRLGILRHLNSVLALTATGFRAYRAPTENELYRTGQVGQQTTLPNPSLQSERATGWETGFVLQTPRPEAVLRTSYFWTRVDRPITALTQLVTATSIIKQRENLGRIESRGVALDGEIHPWNWLTAIGGYQFAMATVTQFTPDPTLVGNWIPQVPRNTGTLQLLAATPRLGTLSMEGRMSGRQFDDDANAFLLRSFFALNAYASHTFQRRFQLFVSGENLLDRSIQVGRTPVLTLGTPRAGRIGINIRLPELR
jgi:outer membrane receptor protein involved in Fe transport